MLDISILMKRTCNLVSTKTTVRCWFKSSCYSDSLPAELNSQYRRAGTSTSLPSMKNIVQPLEKLFLEVHGCDPVYEHAMKDITSKNVIKGLMIECEEVVRLRIVVDDLQAQKSPNHLDDNHGSDSADKGVESPLQCVFSVPTILEIF